MKILVASDSYKQFASSYEVGTLIRDGILQVSPNSIVDVLCIGDGGEGTVDCLVENLTGTYYKIKSFNPIGEDIFVQYGYIDNLESAVISIYDTAGSGQVKKDNWNTLYTSSYGVGYAICELAKVGYKKIIITLGGSIVSDGGLGMAQALGARFYSKFGDLIVANHSFLSCSDLLQIDRIDISQIPSNVTDIKYTILPDVNIKLLGENGQALTFGRQKKATREEVNLIEKSLEHWNNLLKTSFHRDFDKSLCGAAGGLSAGLQAFLSSDTFLGIEYVLDKINFLSICQSYDLIITGEGRLDKTTSLGKACHGIARCCQRIDKTYYGIFGEVREVTAEFRHCYIDASSVKISHSSYNPFSKEAIVHAAAYLIKSLNYE